MVVSNSLRLADYGIRVTQLATILSVFSLPFVEDNIEQVSGDQYRQLLYGSVFMAATLLVAINRIDATVKVLSANPWLWIFIIYTGLSVVWSAYPTVSAKRFLQLLGVTIIGVALVTPGVYASPLTRAIRPVLTLAVILSVIVALALPAYGTDSNGAWHGVTVHKNHLGTIATLCFILWAFTLPDEQRMRGSALFACLLCIVAVLFARSTTSTVLLLILLSLWLLRFASTKLQLSWKLVVLVTIMAVVFTGHVLGIMHGYPLPVDVANSIAGLFGKDATLTGRTDLWALVWNESKQHFWLGTGYQSFWLGEEGRSGILLSKLYWAPTQAHNGYLDILNELGVVGLTIISSLIILHARRLYQLHRINPRRAEIHVLIAISALLVNISETVLFRTAHIWTIVFLLSVIEVPYLLARSEAHSKKLF